MSTSLVSRRDLLRLAAASGCAALTGRLAAAEPATTPARKAAMNTRPIPRTKEQLPTVGLGTWQAFDVDPKHRSAQVEVVKQFLAAGGRVIDSSPMYGRAETTVGDVLSDLNATATP